MDASVPAGAAILLDFIAGFESDGGYEVVFGHHERALDRPITVLSLDGLGALQRTWARKWGSSASGRYQIMADTLVGLRVSLKLKGSEIFTPDLQDRLAYQLLVQRGYARFKAGTLSLEGFALNLAKEWASLPVLAACQGAHRRVAAGETYYAGDRLNRALIDPARVRAVLQRATAARN